MAVYLVTQGGQIVDNTVEAKSLREVAEGLDVGHYLIYTVQSAKAVTVQEVTSTEVVVGKDRGSWNTAEEEE